MEFCCWLKSPEQRLLRLQSPVREWQSLPHCAQQNVEAGLSVWEWDFLPALLSSVCCIRVSAYADRFYSPLTPLRTGKGRRLYRHMEFRCCFLSPGTSVKCKRFSGVSVDSKCLQVTLADVLEAQLGSLGRPLSSCQCSIEKVLGNTTVTTFSLAFSPEYCSTQRSICFSRSFMTSSLDDFRGAVLFCIGPMACLIQSYMPFTLTASAEIWIPGHSWS